jgi:hypothetical protein
VICRRRCGASTSVVLRDAALASSNAGPVGGNAFASSDAAHESRPAEHRGYYHGVDRSLIASGEVSVVAGSAAVADALTKCLLYGHGASTHELLDILGARLVA